LVSANGLAVIMHRFLGHNMSWFASEQSALFLYGPAALCGSSSVHLLVLVLTGLPRHARIASRLS
jgi:hypothetical protein